MQMLNGIKEPTQVFRLHVRGLLPDLIVGLCQTGGSKAISSVAQINE